MAGRALVVDDDDDIRNALVYLLDSAGYDCRELFSGVHVVETALQFRPDVLLMDLSMPEVSGYEALVALKANPESANIPVIIMSSQSSGDVARMVIDMGAANFVSKPWDGLEIVSLVQQITGSLND